MEQAHLEPFLAGQHDGGLSDTITLKGFWRFTLRNALTGVVEAVHQYENVICTVGKTVIANYLTDPTPDEATARINYVALGTNATAPTAADTQLGTEAYRNTVASETNANNVAYVTGFFTAAECNGTYTEAGLFINGTAAANSGKLLSHVAISVTKSAVQTMTIDWSLTIA